MRSKLVARVGGTIGTTLWDSLLDAICPQVCPSCNKPDVGNGSDPCADCLQAIGESTVEPYCFRCGMTVPPYGQSPDGCRKCRGRRLPYDRVIRVGSYANAFSETLRLFKYGGREELDGFFSRQLAGRIAKSHVYDGIDAVVAVPTCWQHRLQRLFHPATIIGKQVARRCGIPFADVLVRVGGGPHHVGQSPAVRQQNVRGKFRIARGCRVQGAKLCLIDDVMTTGATAGECSRVLKKARAAKVYVAILARAGDDLATLKYV